MKYKSYKGLNTKEISFPMGGIGTGSIGLSGAGMLMDWEIYNKPAKNSINGYTNIAIKAEDKSGLVAAKALAGDYIRSYVGDMGPFRNCMAGMPHFGDTEFRGGFPIAELDFRDEAFPAKITLTAFNPFIPLDDKNSSIPAAFLEYDVQNTADRDLDYTICFSMRNNLGGAEGETRYMEVGTHPSLHFFTEKYSPDKQEYGDMTLATDCPDVSYQEHWFRGNGFEPMTIFWDNFTRNRKLTNRRYESSPRGAGMASLAAHFKLGAGESRKVRFALAWNFPNFVNYWNPCKCEDGTPDCSGKNMWKNFYATLFEDSKATAAYCLDKWDELYGGTCRFRDALFGSTLPDCVLEAVSANISILKSPTCLRLSDGSFYGFEGCSGTGGCCEGTCTHVWNYAYALPFLFPALERSMRELDYKYNQHDNGGMSFRITLPPGSPKWTTRSCADGLFGGLLKTYREWKICGSDEWLATVWPAAKQSLEFAWAPDNQDRWDPDKSGVLTGRQHHTLDDELFGPSSWLNGFYAAALKAAAEMADAMGEPEKAAEYRAIWEKSRKYIDKHLFNGEYFVQKINLKDKSIPEAFGAVEHFWNEETGEIRYQIGDGCEVDQVLAQWHANNMGLGSIFEPDKLQSALASIYKYNFKKSMRDYFNPCRLYCFNDESGVVICDWPNGHKMPKVPLPYAQEAMNGFEYSAAVLMIQEGMVDEGLEIVRAVRDRYDGFKRNPWNEFECGYNYARSMASYTLLTALSGFEYDMRSGMLGFDPVQKLKKFNCFFCIDGAWGTFSTAGNTVELTVLYGKLELGTLRLRSAQEREIKTVVTCGTGDAGKTKLKFTQQGADVIFNKKIALEEGCRLELKMKRAQAIF